MADHQNHAGFPTGLNHPPSIYQRIGDRLFDVHVLPIAGGQFRLLRVNRVRGDQQDAVDIISFQQPFIAFFLIASVAPAVFDSFFRRSGETGDQFKLFAPLHRVGNHPRPAPDSDQPDPYRTPCFHSALPSPKRIGATFEKPCWSLRATRSNLRFPYIAGDYFATPSNGKEGSPHLFIRRHRTGRQMFLSKKKGDSAESRGGMVKSRRMVFFVDTRASSSYTPPTKKTAS